MPKLDALFGQASAVASLRRALTGDTLPGAYLFVGAPGVGKGAVSQALAQAAACLSPETDPFDSCGICESCRRAEDGQQPEIVTVQPAGEQTQIWQFWERDGKPQSGLLTRTLCYGPAIGRRRVYIIERAETLSEPAANSLLKVLEEPPPYALFILNAPHAARLLPTVVSRCQSVRITPVPTSELETYLTQALDVEQRQARLYSVLSEGKTGQAVRLVRTPRVADEIAAILDYATTLPDAPPLRALKLAEQMRKLAAQLKALMGDEASADAVTGDDGEGSPKDRGSRRQLGALFDLLVLFYRDLMALSVGGAAAERIINTDRSRELIRLAKAFPTARWIRCLDALAIARRRLDANASIAMVTDVLVLALMGTQ